MVTLTILTFPNGSRTPSMSGPPWSSTCSPRLSTTRAQESVPSSTRFSAEGNAAFRHTRGVVSGEHDERPWGSYTVLDDNHLCKVKRIVVRPGGRLSYK